jgi:serine/threonine protein kinase
MSALPMTHPSLADLKAFGLGKLAPTSAETVLQHVETCLDCQRAVAESSGDSFLGRLRAAQSVNGTKPPEKSLSGVARSLTQPAPPNPFPVESACPFPPELTGNSEYEIVKELGRGGMGVVYLARNTLMGREEVLKVMGRDVMARPGAVDRFKREIQSAARLDHSNIVRAYSARQMGELLVFTMEYVPGEELGALVKARGPLPVVNACYYIQQVANGLQHAHIKGMVHRDIKPANLIRVVQGKKHTVKILDFGLAKLTCETGGDADLTGTGQMMGTPHYMAPEQANDAARADIRADIYSLGCTLHFLLTGGPPFPVNNIFELLLKHREEMPLAVNVVRPQIPMELAGVVAKMMAKDVSQRYQTPAEVAKALAPFIPKAGSAAMVNPQRIVPQSAPQTIIPNETADPVGQIVWPALQPPTPKEAIPASPVNPGGGSAKAWETVLPYTVIGESPQATHTAPRRRRPVWRWSLFVAGMVFAGTIITLTAGGFKARTQYGTIIIENVPTNAQVEIEGERVTITRDGEIVTVTAVKKESHRLKVFQGGKEIWASDVIVKVGGEPVRVRMEQLPPPIPPMQPPTPPTPKIDVLTPIPPPEKRVAIITGSRHGPVGNPERWSVTPNGLEANRERGECYIWFGNPDWEDYTLSFNVLKISGPEGFGVAFRAPTTHEFYLYDLSIHKNTVDALAVCDRGQWYYAPKDGNFPARTTLKPSLKDGETYRVKVEVVGKRCLCYLDNDVVFEHSMELYSKGRIGLRALGFCSVRITDIQIRGTKNEVLWLGYPVIP